jgi:hypothetical protein
MSFGVVAEFVEGGAADEFEEAEESRRVRGCLPLLAGVFVVPRREDCACAAARVLGCARVFGGVAACFVSLGVALGSCREEGASALDAKGRNVGESSLSSSSSLTLLNLLSFCLCNGGGRLKS